MAIQPKITACLKNSCSTLSVTDTTGMYDVTNNPSGWPIGYVNTSISAATLTIFINGVSVKVVDLINPTNQFPATITGTFTFPDIDLTGIYTDGIITVVYSVTDNASGTPIDLATYDFEALYTCQARACIDKMWAEIACKSCSGSCELTDLIDDANLAEGLLRGLESGAVCCDAACINKILAAINQLCNWNNCNC